MFFTYREDGFSHVLSVAVWTGERFEFRNVNMVSYNITRLIEVTVPPEHPQHDKICYHKNKTACVHKIPSWGITSGYDPVRQSMVYGAFNTFICPSNENFQYYQTRLPHRLNDIALRNAIKNAFAKCASKVLSDELITYILSFC